MIALLIQLLRYGWQPLHELWREGGVEEILFEQRNKAYGAYELRRNEGWYLLTAFSIVIGGMLSLGWASTELARKKAEPAESLRLLKISQARFLPPIPLGFCGGPAIPPPPSTPPQKHGHSFQMPIPAPLEEIDAISNHEGNHFLSIIKADTDTVFVFTPQLDFEIPEEEDYIESSDCFCCEQDPKTSWLIGPYEPRPLNLSELYTKISYPQLLRDAEIYQTIIFRVLIDEHGRYIKHEAVQGHPLALAEIEKHLHLLEFTPNPHAFEVSRSWIRIPFGFEPPQSSQNRQ